MGEGAGGEGVGTQIFFRLSAKRVGHTEITDGTERGAGRVRNAGRRRPCPVRGKRSVERERDGSF